MEFLSQFLLYSLLFASVNGIKHSDKKRTGKLFSLFNIIAFPNDPCNNTSGEMGMCYTAAECAAKSGIKGDTCAKGFGVCCQFVRTSGGQSNENITYFDSAGATAPGVHQVRICPATNNICQLRLDFLTFAITGPSTATDTIGREIAGCPVQDSVLGTPFVSATQCLTDQFIVTSPGNPSPPIICGANTGQHMYVESSSECTTLAFVLGTAGLGQPAPPNPRTWRVQVLQFSCDFVNLAPPGCTKYFSAQDVNSRFIQTYNFDGGIHLANQRERFCIRRERNTCHACFFSASLADFDLTGTTNNLGIIGTKSLCCGYGPMGTKTGGFDCLIIPGAERSKVFPTFPTKELIFDEFCGGGNKAIGGLFTKTATILTAVARTICTSRVPFMVSFYSDGFELPGEVTTPLAPQAAIFNKGFRLLYSLQPCP